MAWEENSCISLNMQLIAILSRIGVFPGLALTPDEVAKFWPNKSDGNVMRIISGCIYSFFIDVNLFDNELFAVSYVDARR